MVGGGGACFGCCVAADASDVLYGRERIRSNATLPFQLTSTHHGGHTGASQRPGVKNRWSGFEMGAVSAKQVARHKR